MKDQAEERKAADTEQKDAQMVIEPELKDKPTNSQEDKEEKPRVVMIVEDHPDEEKAADREQGPQDGHGFGRLRHKLRRLLDDSQFDDQAFKAATLALEHKLRPVEDGLFTAKVFDLAVKKLAEEKAAQDKSGQPKRSSPRKWPQRRMLGLPKSKML